MLARKSIIFRILKINTPLLKSCFNYRSGSDREFLSCGKKTLKISAVRVRGEEKRAPFRRPFFYNER
jgi:hypothetical protein